MLKNLLIFVLLILVLAISLPTVEAFNPMYSENISSNQLTLAGSRIGAINNVERILEKEPKLREELEQLNRNFPLSVREPLNETSVSENVPFSRGKGLDTKTINKIIPLPNRDRPQALQRIPRNPTIAFNEKFKISSASLNFIGDQANEENQLLQQTFKRLKKTKGVSPAETLGLNYQPISRDNPISAENIRKIANVFINFVNQETGRKYNYLDKEDAAIEVSYPQVEIPEGQTPTSNLEREFTKYTIVFSMFEENFLQNKLVKVIIVEDTTNLGFINSPKTAKTLKILDANLEVQEKGLLPGFNRSPENQLWDLFTSRDEQHISDREFNVEIKERQRREKEDQFFCFGSTDADILVGSTQTICEQNGGLWDKAVKVNEECPFFKSNKNYLNSRGGVKGNGFCELPLGMQLKGFRNPSPNPDSKPLCYNCLDGFSGFKTLGECCEEQRTDKVKYPTLLSPDYAFSGDQQERKHARKQLRELDLNWHRQGFQFEN